MCFKEGWRPVWRQGSGKQEGTHSYTALESRGGWDGSTGMAATISPFSDGSLRTAANLAPWTEKTRTRQRPLDRLTERRLVKD